MSGRKHTTIWVAAVFTVATFFTSCKSQLQETDSPAGEAPFQTVENMFSVQTTNGVLQTRMEAPLMESYTSDSLSYDLFPMGISVYSYNEDGDLESVILADKARHEKKKSDQTEVWAAYGNVLVQNVTNQESMQTDTLYWDRTAHELYTDCYVKMISPDGLMQGYGFRSDEKATKSQLLKPFNNFMVVVQDSTQVRIDSVNFIGPFVKK